MSRKHLALTKCYGSDFWIAQPSVTRTNTFSVAMVPTNNHVLITLFLKLLGTVKMASKNSAETRIVRESDYSPAAVLCMQ